MQFQTGPSLAPQARSSQYDPNGNQNQTQKEDARQEQKSGDAEIWIVHDAGHHRQQKKPQNRGRCDQHHPGEADRVAGQIHER